jgi:hypothetical protein
MVSATAAGVFPSTTQTTVCPDDVGSCGDTKTAPSGPSAAVTAPAEKGRGIGELTVNGPDVDTGGSAAKVELVEVGTEDVPPFALATPDVVVVDVCALGASVPHAATTSAATTTRPNCTRRVRTRHMSASIAVPAGGIAVLPEGGYGSRPW